jgi:catechol 2,3-dioxygenase-like lactoylglutathione lyase family enzyme
MTAPASTLTGISTVAIAVSDQDATKRLFEQLGFHPVFDAEVAADFRWIDMAAPDGGCRLSVIAATDALPPGDTPGSASSRLMRVQPIVVSLSWGLGSVTCSTGPRRR